MLAERGYTSVLVVSNKSKEKRQRKKKRVFSGGHLFF
jgi:hypothetical protein